MSTSELTIHLQTRLTGIQTGHQPGNSSAPETKPGDFDRREAMRAFERAIRLAPSDPDYHFLMGEALLQDGRHGEAQRALSEATRLHPEEPTYQLALGEVLWRLGRFEQAAGAFSKASELEPDDADAWGGLGAARAMASSDGALTALRHALRLDARRADAQNNLAALEWRRGAHEDALRILRAATRDHPRTPFLLINLGTALAQQDSPAEAQRVLRRAVRLAPRSAEPLVALAELCYAIGREPQALTAFERAIMLSPSCLDERARSQEHYKKLLREAVNGELSTGLSGGLGSRTRDLLDRGREHLADALAGLHGSFGRLSVGTLLLLGIALIVTLVRLGGPYIRYWVFKDAVAQVAQAPVVSDQDVRARLQLAIRENNLTDYVRDDSCAISTLDKTRTIACRYAVTIELLPRITHTFDFTFKVERFYLQPEKTIFF